LAKEAGCALVVSEMVSANGLVHGGQRTLELLKSHPSERPLSVQIFGKDPDVMKDAAQIVQDQGADMVDINLGCSVRKIVRQGAGVALMREPERLESILKAVRTAVHLPFTVKIRSGWDPSGDQAVRISRIAQDSGVDAVALHPRTAAQGFSGRADWTLISRLKENLSISVMGNGDICKPADVLKMQRETDCDAVMIGRAAMGNPWIFSQALDLINGRQPKVPDLSARLQLVLRYIDYAVDHFGEFRAVCMMRSRLVWFVKGLPRCSAFRGAIVRLKTQEEMTDAVCAYFEELKTSGWQIPEMCEAGGKNRPET
jgi:nifR3 family TIM-barrel protein